MTSPCSWPRLPGFSTTMLPLRVLDSQQFLFATRLDQTSGSAKGIRLCKFPFASIVAGACKTCATIRGWGLHLINLDSLQRRSPISTTPAIESSRSSSYRSSIFIEDGNTLPTCLLQPLSWIRARPTSSPRWWVPTTGKVSKVGQEEQSICEREKTIFSCRIRSAPRLDGEEHEIGGLAGFVQRAESDTCSWIH